MAETPWCLYRKTLYYLYTDAHRAHTQMCLKLNPNHGVVFQPSPAIIYIQEQPSPIPCSYQHHHLHYFEAGLNRLCLTSVANAAIRSITTLYVSFSQQFHFLVACFGVWGFFVSLFVSLVVLVWFFILSNFYVCVFVVFVYFSFLSSASQNKPQKTKPVLEKKFMLLTATTILNFLIWFFLNFLISQCSWLSMSSHIQQQCKGLTNCNMIKRQKIFQYLIKASWKQDCFQCVINGF